MRQLGSPEKDWLYQTDFKLNSEPDHCRTIILKANGIDTYAEIWLNGILIGETKNNYRIYEFPLTASLLRAGENRLQIRVKSHARMIKPLMEMASRLNRNTDVTGTLGKSLIRRYQRSFFSGSSLLNLGTSVLGIGINKPIELLFFTGSRLHDCYYRTLAANSVEAQGELTLALDIAPAGKSQVVIKIADEAGHEVFSQTAVPQQTGQESELILPVTIRQPKLWWPAGYGSAHLYQLTVDLFDDGQMVQTCNQKIGIRTVELIERLPDGKDTFYFAVNGKRIYIRGHNFIPIDYIKVHGEKEEYDRLFLLMRHASTNMVRIWGGGAVEEPYFYDQCDKLGILVWQEFFLHSNVYPDYDADFVREFIEESEGIIKQVRPHVSLALLCGGNEQQEGWDEWGWKDEIPEFYGEKLPKEYVLPSVSRMCPDIPYINNSPHGGKWGQSPVQGECHNWGNFYNATKDPLFVTETCWSIESYSRPETLKKYMDLDVEDYNHFQWFDQWHETTSLSRVNRLPYSNWFTPCSLKEYLHSLEIEQARADYQALSLFRLHSPSNSGFIYWPLNKGGPLFQFGCVDYGGYPMMSYYIVKRLFDRIAVGVYRDLDSLRVTVSNQGTEPLAASLEVTHLHASGQVLNQWLTPLAQDMDSLQEAFSLSGYYSTIQDRTKEVLFARVIENEVVVAEDMLFFLSLFGICTGRVLAHHEPSKNNRWTMGN